MGALRKVMVSKYITRTLPPEEHDAARGITGRTVATWEEVGEALFHQFGLDYEEFETGPGNFSTAIVEWPDGKVEMVRADRIRFLEPLPVVSKEDGLAIIHDLHGVPSSPKPMTTEEIAAGLVWDPGTYTRAMRATRDDPACGGCFEDWALDEKNSEPVALAAYRALSEGEQEEISEAAHDRAVEERE